MTLVHKVKHSIVDDSKEIPVVTVSQSTPKKIYKTVKEYDFVPFEDDLLNTAFKEFIDYRIQTKKGLSQLSITKLVNKINKFNCSTESIIESIDNSISNGWTGIFEPKSTKFNNNDKKAVDF